MNITHRPLHSSFGGGGTVDRASAEHRPGAELVGAGAGGFLLLPAPEVDRRRAATTAAGRPDMHRSSDRDGSAVTVRG